MDFRNIKEKVLEYTFLGCAIVGVIGIIAIFAFVAQKGLPVFQKVGLKEFLLSADWLPTQGRFGILPFVAGTLIVTTISLIIGGTLGIISAIFFAEIASKSVRNAMRPVLELLAAIPSVVYGFFGILVIAPYIDKINGPDYPGLGLLTASLVLSVMILPTIATIAEDSLQAVSVDFKNGSFAMGATRWQTISRVVLPAAKSGIFAAVILGMGRAVGETMAVYMLIGGAPIIPKSIYSLCDAMASIIARDMGYASGLHRSALFAIGLVLYIFVMIIISMAYRFGGKKRW